MQFVANGPNVPNELIQAHEEGRVVFFCGAGISYNAKLPLFHGLVKDIYKSLGTTCEGGERGAFRRRRYDSTLNLLEQRYPNGRVRVRKALAQRLEPDLEAEGATTLHRALLQLSHSDDGQMKLVTTNYDRIFEMVAKSQGLNFAQHSAPMLPVPKMSRWNGLVYLHGLLPEPKDIDKADLNHLVLTSGDFGLAYLTEAWAARFVTELFRNFIVCFVGYSIEDPVLRYMMDALAADAMLGEAQPDTYAFGSYRAGQQESEEQNWKAKGVRPILYEVMEGHDHSLLSKTLSTWGRTFSDGSLGKERIVVEHAGIHPSESTKEDDYVGRMLWALSDPSGNPAKKFANIKPTPPLSWLKCFNDSYFTQSDLLTFGVACGGRNEDKLKFSLTHRPAPLLKSQFMSLFRPANPDTDWDSIMGAISHWLTKHLHDPELLLWFAEKHSEISSHLAGQFSRQLDNLQKIESESGWQEAQMPTALITKIWRYLISGKLEVREHSLSIYKWKEQLKQSGLTNLLRLELRELLSPRIVVNRGYSYDGVLSAECSAEEAINRKLRIEVVLAPDSGQYLLLSLFDAETKAIMPSLLDDLQRLLTDALDLLSDLGLASSEHDRSHWRMRSISDHWQNKHLRGWVILIKMTRDAWLEMMKVNPVKAKIIALSWFDINYPTFRRLALFAASKPNVVPPEIWLPRLSGDVWGCLWDVQYQRELLRLFVGQGSLLSDEQLNELTSAILAGPPREMYRQDLSQQRWVEISKRQVWLRLKKLEQGGASLSTDAAAKLTSICVNYPGWQLEDHEREEFTSWSSGTGDPDFTSRVVEEKAPETLPELISWIKVSKDGDDNDFRHRDDWEEVCQNNTGLALAALQALANEKLWPVRFWRGALNAWSDERSSSRSWGSVHPLLLQMSKDSLKELTYPIGRWLSQVSKSLKKIEPALLDLALTLWEVDYETSETDDDPIFSAINHPIGQATEALLNNWFATEPSDKDGLPESLMPAFELILEESDRKFVHGRVILASRVISFYRVDEAWTRKHLLPKFNWDSNHEARHVWEGFLWAPRLHWPLLVAMKEDLLSSAAHYEELAENSQQFVQFLTYAALEPGDGFDVKDFQPAFAMLPIQALTHVLYVLKEAVDSAGDRLEGYVDSRLRVFWQEVWPKHKDKMDEQISDRLTVLAIATGNRFPTVIDWIRDWILPTKDLYFVISELLESGHCQEFPRDALSLLELLIDDQPFPPKELETCLERITSASPALKEDAKYLKVERYLNRHT